MTRRQLGELIVASAAATSACAQSRILTSDSLLNFVVGQNLAILGWNLEALRPPKTPVGRLILTEPLGVPGEPSVSPDARSVAWIRRSVMRIRADQTQNRTIFFMNDPRSIRSIPYGEGAAVRIGLSGGGLIYLVVAVDRASARLISIGEQLASENDHSNIVSKLDLSQVEQLRPSADGSRLAIGWRESLVVLDTSRQIIAEEEGRFPALSPDGKRIAFVNKRQQFIVMTIGAGERRLLADDWIGGTIGAWSPDGRWLLGGARRHFSSETSLLALDVERNASVELWSLGDDSGNRSLWIGKHLLTA